MERKVWDVNVLAIYLVEDHPGNPYVSEVVERGLLGEYTPVLLDVLPIRAYWIMVSRWGVNKRDAMEAVQDFLAKYDAPEYRGLSRESMLRAFSLARELKHDVYDCAYLSFAIQEGASSIVTTDRDFERLAPRVGLVYENPVPLQVLKRFRSWSPER